MVVIVDSNNNFLSKFWTVILTISSYKLEKVDMFQFLQNTLKVGFRFKCGSFVFIRYFGDSKKEK